MPTGRVTALFRHPVKSLGGEAVADLEVTTIGAVGDRNWAVVDRERACIRNAKQWPQLLQLRATYLRPPVPDAYDDAVSPVRITSPDGTSRDSGDADVDEWLSAQLGRPARLAARRPASDRAHYRLARARTPDDIAAELDLLDEEVLPDFGLTEDALLASLQTSVTPPGTYVDAYPLHVLSQRSLDVLAERSGLDCSAPRFRPNLLLEVSGEGDEPELGWVGRRVRVGDLLLGIRSPTYRCSMPSRPQPLLGLAGEPAMTRALVRQARRLLGVNALVIRPGTIHIGDHVTIGEPVAADEGANPSR
jgi:uncharacterized protein YcbX